MSSSALETGSIRFDEVSFEQLERFPNAIEDIHSGRFHGLVVRGAFPAESLEQVARRIESEDVVARMMWPEHEGAPDCLRVLGRPLMVEFDDERYFAGAAQFRNDCRALFAGLPDYEERVSTVLRALSGGRSVAVPTTHDGSIFSPGTIRLAPPGAVIPLHVGNEFLHYPQARKLAVYADISCQLSFFVTLRPADAGGELTVYSLQWSDIEKLRIERDGYSRGYGSTGRAQELASRSERLVFKPGAGDLVIFDGGRYYHRVTSVEGEHNRITIGGFLVFSLNHDTVYYWH